VSAPQVSILVAVLDEAELIEQTARDIAAQHYDGELEVLFLDGGSQDGTVEQLRALAAEDPRIRVIDNPRRTQVSALNLGLRESRGEVVVQMDAHTFYGPDYVAEGVRRLQRGDV
jgi:succinoglycan biosynthesis protein ExoA